MNPRDGQPSRRMRLSLWLALSMLLVLGAVGAFALRPEPAKSPPPDLVARVNGDAISWAELRRAKADLADLRRRLDAPKPDPDELQDQALRSLIHRRLFLEEAKRRNFVVSDDAFDTALSELSDRFPDLDSFGEWMRRRGLDDAKLIATIREDLLVDRVVAALAQDVRITEQQYRDYYDAHRDDLTVGEDVRLRIIAVTTEATAQQILDALSDGGNFTVLARQVSRGARAAEGGDTGWMRLASLPLPLRQAVTGMNVGDATGPLRKAADEFLVVALAARRPVNATSFDEARPEIERRLLAAKQRAAMEQWLTERRRESEIDVFL